VNRSTWVGLLCNLCAEEAQTSASVSVSPPEAPPAPSIHRFAFGFFIEKIGVSHVVAGDSTNGLTWL
jgi:hypothetical protein